MLVYAREGVRHAWLVDPITRTLEVLVLGEDRRWGPRCSTGRPRGFGSSPLTPSSSISRCCGRSSRSPSRCAGNDVAASAKVGGATTPRGDPSAGRARRDDAAR
ncbi:hypothetical protein WMF12_17265 [Sorangium sp. So ce363]